MKNVGVLLLLVGGAYSEKKEGKKGEILCVRLSDWKVAQPLVGEMTFQPSQQASSSSNKHSPPFSFLPSLLLLLSILSFVCSLLSHRAYDAKREVKKKKKEKDDPPPFPDFSTKSMATTITFTPLSRRRHRRLVV